LVSLERIALVVDAIVVGEPGDGARESASIQVAFAAVSANQDDDSANDKERD